MKNIKLYSLAVAFAAFCSCNSDPLGLKLTNTWEDESVWAIPRAAEGVLIKAYLANPNLPDSFGNSFLDTATDNAMTYNHTSSAWTAGNGGFSRTNSVISNWGQCYNQFQYIHEFLQKGLTEKTLYNRVDPDKDAAIKRRLEGEAYFLRAWWGFQLLQRHGGRSDDGRALGYPIVTKFIDKDNVNDPELFVRNTYEECVNQILIDCDSAIVRLPMKYDNAEATAIDSNTNVGRATATAAWMLKSNVTLYGASPAFQDNAVVRIDGMGAFTVLDATAVQKKWERAALTADSVLQTDNFGAFYAIKAADLAVVPNVTPDEFVFRRYNNSNNLENRHNPPFNYGRAETVPSENFSRAFPAKNGFPTTDPRSGYTDDDPYSIARDNRFKLNLYHHGQTYNTQQGEIDMVYGGNGSAAYSSYASNTGYYLAKFISNKAIVNYHTRGNTAHYYPYIRKAEAFLNYAEAANEAWGPNAKDPTCQYTAYEIIKIIRQKSGGITNTVYLDEMAATKETFRELIQNERRLELSFENHRFFDMRRCLLPLNETVKGMTVTRDEDTGDISFEVVEVEQRPMNDVKYYFIPVPVDELMKSPTMVNNMGWE